MHYDIWKYCTKDQWIQYLLSMNLTGNLRLSDEKKLALLYELSNHAEEHYTTIRIPKTFRRTARHSTAGFSFKIHPAPDSFPYPRSDSGFRLRLCISQRLLRSRQRQGLTPGKTPF